MALVTFRHRTTGLYGTLEADGQGYYWVRVEFDALVPRIDFVAARMQALAYAALVQEQFNFLGVVVGDIVGVSRRGRPKKLDLESTFVCFLITSMDGNWPDALMTKRFRHALNWANRQWRDN